MPRLRWSVAGFPLQKSGFDPRPFSVAFVVDEVALGHVCLRVLRPFCDSIIPSLLHAHLHLHSTLTNRANGRSLGPFQRSALFKQSGQHRMKKCFQSFVTQTEFSLPATPHGQKRQQFSTELKDKSGGARHREELTVSRHMTLTLT